MGQEQSQYDASSGSKQLGMSLRLRLLFPLSGIYVNLLKNSSFHQTHVLFCTETIDTLVQMTKGSKILSMLLLFSSPVKNSSTSPDTFLLSGEENDARQY